jgi:aminoglycoside 3-N-acetyltransferase
VLITAAEITNALADLGVARDDAILVHSGLRGALRVEGASAADKADTVIDALSAAVPAGILAMPTFTYSFTRGEDFDLDESPSIVGALGERFRRRAGVSRTADPLFSVALSGSVPYGWEEPLFAVGDKDCFGDESVFALLREARGKVVFFGVGFEFCTFVHHVEQRLDVPYRFPKPFHGRVHSRSEGSREVTATYFVRPLDEDVEPFLDPLADALLAIGGARGAVLGDGLDLLVADTDAIASTIARRLEENPDFLLTRGHALV